MWLDICNTFFFQGLNMGKQQLNSVLFYHHMSKEQQRIYNLMRNAKYGDMICENLFGNENDFRTVRN